MTIPAEIIAAISNHGRGVCIFIERIAIRAKSAPAPTEWIEIFHQKFISVTAITNSADASIKDLINSGM